MTYLVRLQFIADGPAVTGQWVDGATARRTWREWVGLYGSDKKVVIRLNGGAGDRECPLLAWEQGSLVGTGDAGRPGKSTPQHWPAETSLDSNA